MIAVDINKRFDIAKQENEYTGFVIISLILSSFESCIAMFNSPKIETSSVSKSTLLFDNLDVFISSIFNVSSLIK